MIPIEITGDINSVSQLITDLEEIDRKVGGINSGNIKERLVKVIFRANQQNILTQGKRLNDEYAPLSKKYKAYKDIVKPNQPINIFEGLLFEVVGGEDQSALNIFTTDGSTASVVNTLRIEYINPYILFVQKARVLLGLNDDDEREMAQIIEEETLGFFS